MGARVAQLAGLWAIVFVQPLFSVLDGNAAFFVARDNSPGDVLIFAFGWTLVPPALAALLLLITKSRAFYPLLWFIASVFALQVIKPLSEHAAIVLPPAALLGAGLAYAHHRFEPLQTFTTFLGIAPPVLLALFLLFSPVHDVVFPTKGRTPGAAQIDTPTPVVLMIFDELPTLSLMTSDKEVDAGRYPNFARLADQSTWYQRATSVADGTYVAVPAILTGKRPEAELPTEHVYPDNLFSLLGRGYGVHDQEPLTSICSPSVCGERPRQRQRDRLESLADDLAIVERRLLLPTGMRDDLPAIDRDFEAFADKPATGDLPARRVREARRVVRTMKPGNGSPGLWMVHNVVPHVPWRFEPDGSEYAVDGPSIPGLDDDSQTWDDNPFLLDQAYQRHFLMTRFADTLLGEAIDRMQQTGLWDKALVIVVADHGGAIGANESRRPVTTENFAKVAGVPFFVKRPGQKTGETSDTFVTTMDIVPTIAKLLGAETDFAFDGVPVDEPRVGGPDLLRMRNGREAELVGRSPQQFADAFDAELAAQARRFPAGLDGIDAVGPRQDLVGTPLAALASGDAPGSADLAAPSPYVTGTTDDVPAGTDLIVAVNGEIEASGEAYDTPEGPRFSMLIDPESLRPGSNRIEVLRIDRGAATSLAVRG